MKAGREKITVYNWLIRVATSYIYQITICSGQLINKIIKKNTNSNKECNLTKYFLYCEGNS